MGVGSQGIELWGQDHRGRQWGKPQGSESYGAGPQSKQQWVGIYGRRGHRVGPAMRVGLRTGPQGEK